MGRNFKLKGRTLLTADIIKPEIPYAEFSESILHMEAKNIINELNYGWKMLELYEQSRSNMHIVSVAKMLEKMEECFMAYDYRRTGIKKGGKNENRVF